MSECSSSAALATLIFSAMSSKESSVVVRRAYSDGLGETDGSSHPSDTKNLSMWRTVSA